MEQIREGSEVVLHPSWLNYFKHFFWALVFIFLAFIISSALSLIFIIIALILILYAIFGKLSRTYTITHKVVRSRIGIVSRNENEIKIDNIHEVGIRQGIFQRIFNVGNIFFASAATSGVEVIFDGIKDPAGVKNQVNQLQH